MLQLTFGAACESSRMHRGHFCFQPCLLGLLVVFRPRKTAACMRLCRMECALTIRSAAEDASLWASKGKHFRLL